MPQWQRARRYLEAALDMPMPDDLGQLTINKGVQDRHSAVGNTGIGVNLFQHYSRRVSDIQAKERDSSRGCASQTEKARGVNVAEQT